MSVRHGWSRGSTSGEQRVAAVTAAVGLVLLVVLAALLVPWQPVPGGMPAAVPADQVFTTAQIDRAEHYATWARVWGWSSLAISLLVAAWLGLGRRGAALVGRLRGWWWVRVVQAVLALDVIGQVAVLLLRAASRQLALDSGLTTQSWLGWARDLLVAIGVDVVLTSLALVVVLGCARRWRRAWPAVAGVGAAVLVMVGSFVWPVLVEPLSNNFEPLPDGALRTDVFALAKAEGVHIDDVLVADASRRTTTLNAYVSGFGDTRRVVLYDNLVDDVPRAEALSVVAHELGHAKHDDVLVGSALGAAGAMVGVGLLALLVEALARRRGTPAMPDVRVVPLVLALVAIGSFLALPAQNAVSRKIETRADVAALETTHDPAAFIAVQKQLAVRSLADPTSPAWSQWWFGSHPTALQRVAVAEQLGG